MNGSLNDLKADVPLVFDGYELSFKHRENRRLVIHFLAPEEVSIWLDELCEEAGFSQLRVVGTGPVPTALAHWFERFGTSKEAAEFSSCSLCAATQSCETLLELGAHLPGAVIVLIDPSVEEGAASAAWLNTAPARYVFYDPFNAPQSLPRIGQSEKAQYFKCFGFGPDCLAGLARMKLLPVIRAAMLSGELNTRFFYERLRARKSYVFYRRGIEAALTARGQDQRMRRFRKAFRMRRDAMQPEKVFARQIAEASENAPDTTGAWVRADGAGAEASWPSAGGNIWMLETRANALRYMSDRWNRAVIGYEERHGVTLAQTPPLALGFASFGGDTHVARALERRYEWHVVDERLDGTLPVHGAVSEATLAAEAQERGGEALHTLLALNQPQPGATPDDTTPDAPPYVALLGKVRQATDALREWDKSLVIDRLRLGLLRGVPDMSHREAVAQYTECAARLAEDLTQITGQSALPLIMLTQGAGFREHGRIEPLLAEGTFDLDNPGLNAVVATPAYPYPLMKDTPATPDTVSAMIMDELCDHAARAKQSGGQWFCPSLQMARLSGLEILAEFSSMEHLVLEDGAHGFRLDGAPSLPLITRAEVVGERTIRLELTDGPGDVACFLAYAWGHDAPRDGFAANHGALRDDWRHPSALLPGQTLNRYALSGRVPLLR